MTDDRDQALARWEGIAAGWKATRAAFQGNMLPVSHWLVEAIHRRDYAAVQGGILCTATIIIGVNLIVDVLYGVINPRIRHS